MQDNKKIGKFIHRTTCRLCGSNDLWLFLDMGYMPLAGNYLKEEQIGKEEYFPLRIFFCRQCSAVQLLDIISPNELFRDYRYLSSIGLTAHFQEYAEEMVNDFLEEGDFVVEIGSNDGVLLDPLQKRGMKVLGIDPADNIASVARKKGIPTLSEFFTSDMAKGISLSYGKASAIFANNVLAHIDDMWDVAEGIALLLKDDGILVFEVHYLIDLLEGLQYDFFYPGEHLTYYSLTAIVRFYAQFEMEVFDVKRTSIHGGSIRVYVQKKSRNRRVKTKRFLSLLETEKNMHLFHTSVLQLFAERVRTHRKKLRDFLYVLCSSGKRVVGYGAAGRANTLLTFAGIDRTFLPYIVDASPERYGRFTPATHIPIVAPLVFHEDRADYVLILAWSYASSISKKEHAFVEHGGKFIIPFPKIGFWQ